MANVSVPQADGEITLSSAGDSHTYSVKKNSVKVPDEELAEFLANVAGSAVIESESATVTEEPSQ